MLSSWFRPTLLNSEWRLSLIHWANTCLCHVRELDRTIIITATSQMCAGLPNRLAFWAFRAGKARASGTGCPYVLPHTGHHCRERCVQGSTGLPGCSLLSSASMPWAEQGRGLVSCSLVNPYPVAATRGGKGDGSLLPHYLVNIFSGKICEQCSVPRNCNSSTAITDG